MENAAEIRGHQGILNLKNEEDEDALPDIQVKYHRSCRSNFTHKKSLLKFTDISPVSATVENEQIHELRRSQRDLESTNILPDLCIFCKKEKYQTKSSTHE